MGRNLPCSHYQIPRTFCYICYVCSRLKFLLDFFLNAFPRPYYDEPPPDVARQLRQTLELSTLLLIYIYALARFHFEESEVGVSSMFMTTAKIVKLPPFSSSAWKYALIWSYVFFYSTRQTRIFFVARNFLRMQNHIYKPSLVTFVVFSTTLNIYVCLY